MVEWEFDDDLLGILDFPMESLEGGELAGDWDMSNVQCLGPIPSIDLWPLNEATWQHHQLFTHVDTSSSHIQQQNKLGNVHDYAAFKTQNPVLVLESSGSCLGGKDSSTKSSNAIPVRSRSKRVRPVGVNPWLLASPEFSTSQKAQRSNENQKKSFQIPSVMDFMKCSPENVENLKSASSPRSMVTKKCHHCESTKTPQWRDGPLGPKTLCNACGVRYRSGRLFPEYRPVKSPSFAPSKHSNSHKKVIEIRNKQSACIIKVAPISPQLKAKTEEPASSPQPELPYIQIIEAPEHEQLSNSVGASHLCQQNKFSSISESGAFGTQSSVSVLESRSKCVRSSHVNPLLLASKTLNTRSKETLHMSILESRGSILAGKGSSIEHDNTIPVPSRKRVRPKRLNQSYVTWSELSTSQKALNTRRSKDSKKTLAIKVANLSATSDLGHRENASANRPSINKKCAHCESTKTPQWRKGPMGLLCNACGVRYRKGRLFPEYRPADSPTFVPSKHSNSHKTVAEMRNKVKQLEGKIKVTPISTQHEDKAEERPLSPQPEFVPSRSYLFGYATRN